MEFAEIVDPGQPLKLASKPLPAVPSEGFLLKTDFAGVCHTDLHFIRDENDIGGGKVFRRREVIGIENFRGIVPGHEFGGTILEFGAEARPEEHGLKVGDKVIIHASCGCRKCGVCKAGYHNLCLENNAARYDLGLGYLNGRVGGYSTHVAVPFCALGVKVPTTIPMDLACTMACSTATAYTALLAAGEAIRFAHECYNKVDIMMVGAGGLALWGIQLCKLVYPGINFTISCSDILESKKELAHKVGADNVHIIHKNMDRASQVKLLTENGTRHYDAIIDFVGHPASTEVAIDSLKKNGAIIIVGINGGGLTIPLPMLTWKAMTMRGIRMATMSDLKKLVQLVGDNSDKIFYPKPEYYELKELNAVLGKLSKGEIKGRAVVKF